MQGSQPLGESLEICMYIGPFFMMTFTVLTSNINGTHDTLKWTEIWGALPRADMICLKEMHLLPEQEYSYKLHAQSHDFFFSHGTSASVGVCVAVRRLCNVNIDKVASIPRHLDFGLDNEARWLYFSFDLCVCSFGQQMLSRFL